MSDTIIREILYEEIQKEIVGPYEENEVFQYTESPKSKYISGVLYPIQTSMNDEDIKNNTTASKDIENSANLEKIPINVGTKPSSMGLTCNISQNQKTIIAKISYARYLPITLTTKDEKTSKDKNILDDDKYPDWKRILHEPKLITIDTSKKNDKIELESNIFFRYFINHNKGQNYFSLSAFITNEASVKKDEYVKDNQCVFQPQIKLISPNSLKIFLNISKISSKQINQISSSDERITAFLFRNFKNFATGRNCSVEWDQTETSQETGWVQTTFTPHYIVPEIKPSIHCR